MEVRIGSAAVEVAPRRKRFWNKVQEKRWEQATIAAISDLIGPGAVFIDIGAWIGPTTMLAAHRGAEVHAYEPDPVALVELKANLALNPDLLKRTHVHPVALSNHDGDAPIGSKHLGDSETSLLKRGGETTIVPTMDAARAAEIDHFRRATLVKMDIEGGEYLVIPRMTGYLRAHEPVLILSTHSKFMRQRYAQLPRLIRVALVSALLVPRQLRLVWRLRFYRRWDVEVGRGWRRVSFPHVAGVMLSTRNHEFLLRP
jgi:FkbM family methyltransferase